MLSSRSSRSFTIVFSGVFVAAAAVVISPLLPFSSAFPALYMITAFQSFLFFLVGVLFALIALRLLIGRSSRGTSGRIILGISTLLSLACFLGSYLTASGSSLSSVEDIPEPEPGTLRILSWNTDKVVDDQEVIELAKQTRPDIIVLPEQDQTVTSSFDCRFVPQDVSEHVGFLCDIGLALDMNVYFWKDAAAQTMFISRSLGDYTPINDDTPPFAGFYAEPSDPHSSSPRLTAVHLQRPEFRIGTDWWRSHLAWAQKSCSTPLSIAAGDFNATQRNIGSAYVGSCQDIADALGSPSAGTWPSHLPAFWGAPIDHVYIGSAYDPVWFGVLSDAHGSEHRPIFAIVKPKAQ